MRKLLSLLIVHLLVCTTAFSANFLTFMAEEAESSFKVDYEGGTPCIEYSTDGGSNWVPATFEDVFLKNKGDKVLLRGSIAGLVENEGLHPRFYVWCDCGKRKCDEFSRWGWRN